MTNLNRGGKIICVAAFFATLPLAPLLHDIPLVRIRWSLLEQSFALATPLITALLSVCWYRALTHRFLILRRFGFLAGFATAFLTYISYALLFAALIALQDIRAATSAFLVICTFGLIFFGWIPL